VFNKCKWTDKALDDLLTIQEYISQDNPKASIDITNKIVLKVVEQLSRFQNMGKAGRVNGTRELIIPNTPYIAVYWIKSNTVEVLRVLHTSMKWPDSFNKL
jgi:toxin ParE1/3/4